MNKITSIAAKAYLIIALLIPVFPQSNTMDVVGLQWFGFSILNCVSLFFIIPNITFKRIHSLNKVFLVFILLAIISIIYSINTSLALQDISRWIHFIIGVNILSYLIKRKFISFEYIVNVFVLILFIEMVYILIPLFIKVYLNGIDQKNLMQLTPGMFNGLTGNKNIAAASIMVKLPFLAFKMRKLNTINIVGSMVIILLAILSILFIAARASYISFVLFSFLLFISGIFFIKKSFRKKTLYYFLPIFLAYFSAFSLGNKLIPSESSASLSNKVNSISFTKAGSSGRTLLWSDALDFASKHPFIGGGIGSWKIESAPYWNVHGAQYLVPYHAHNDFLEITAELGFLGGSLYILIFGYLLFLFIIKSFFSQSESSLFYLVCLTSLSIYLVDAMFNFPMERYIMQISLSVLFAVGISFENKLG